MAQLMVITNAWIKPDDRFDGISAIDHLFNRLDGMYPNVFKANFKSMDSINNWKHAWSEAFVDEGIQTAEVKEGLKNVRRMYEFPPSLPQFLKACRHVDYECLFVESVRGHMSRRTNHGEEVFGWTSPIAFWAGVEFGVHDLLSAQYEKAKTRWQSCVEKAQKKGLKPIPDVIKQLAAPEFKNDSPLAKEVTSRVLKSLDAGNHRKYWAELINAEGFEELPFITKQMAANGLKGLGMTVPEHSIKYLKKDVSR